MQNDDKYLINASLSRSFNSSSTALPITIPSVNSFSADTHLSDHILPRAAQYSSSHDHGSQSAMPVATNSSTLNSGTTDYDKIKEQELLSEIQELQHRLWQLQVDEAENKHSRVYENEEDLRSEYEEEPLYKERSYDGVYDSIERDYEKKEVNTSGRKNSSSSIKKDDVRPNPMKLIVVSNRLPLNVVKDPKTGEYDFRMSSGGLVTALNGIGEEMSFIWVGWVGREIPECDQPKLVAKIQEKFGNNLVPVFLSDDLVDLYYNGFSNDVLWPLFHYQPLPSFKQGVERKFEVNMWQAYKQANEKFADVVARVIIKNRLLLQSNQNSKGNSVSDGKFVCEEDYNNQASEYIWVHDYHLMMLPKLIREKLNEYSNLFSSSHEEWHRFSDKFPSEISAQILGITKDLDEQRNNAFQSLTMRFQVQIGWFLHVPFPSSEVYRMLPVRKEILEGVLASDLIGFHTYDYARHFLSACTRVLGLEASPKGVEYNGLFCSIGVYPIGIEPEYFIKNKAKAGTKARIKQLRSMFGNIKVLLGVDRLDYIKGMPHKLLAMEYFLKKHPEWVSKVVLVQIGVPTRSDVDEYKVLCGQVNELVGRINGRYGSLDYTPIHYINRSVTVEELCALYTIADAAVITSIRDGMNLVSHEFVVCQDEKPEGQSPGVMILSEFAGSAQSLSGAIRVNPWNTEQLANSYFEALTLGKAERELRHNKLSRYVNVHTAAYWAKSFVTELKEACVINSHSGSIFEAIPLSIRSSNRQFFTNQKILEKNDHGFPLTTKSFRNPNESIASLENVLHKFRRKQLFGRGFSPSLDNIRVAGGNELIDLPVKQILQSYKQASKRLIVCSLENTLISMNSLSTTWLSTNQTQNGSKSVSLEDVIETLNLLHDDEKNTVFVVSSGSKRRVLQRLKNARFGIAAEHGFIYRLPLSKGQYTKQRWDSLDDAFNSKFVQENYEFSPYSSAENLDFNLGGVNRTMATAFDVREHFKENGKIIGATQDSFPDSYEERNSFTLPRNFHANSSTNHDLLTNTFGDGTALPEVHPKRSCHFQADNSSNLTNASSVRLEQPPSVNLSANTVASSILPLPFIDSAADASTILDATFTSLLKTDANIVDVVMPQESSVADWKNIVLPVLMYFTERTPGSVVEEKQMSLTWNYMNADQDFGAWQAKDLQVHLEDVVSDLPLEVFQGNKQVEVRHTKANKAILLERIFQLFENGVFSRRKLSDTTLADSAIESSDTIEDNQVVPEASFNASSSKADFVLCCGSDRSDEDMLTFLLNIKTYLKQLQKKDKRNHHSKEQSFCDTFSEEKMHSITKSNSLSGDFQSSGTIRSDESKLSRANNHSAKPLRKYLTQSCAERLGDGKGQNSDIAGVAVKCEIFCANVGKTRRINNKVFLLDNCKQMRELLSILSELSSTKANI